VAHRDLLPAAIRSIQQEVSVPEVDLLPSKFMGWRSEKEEPSGRSGWPELVRQG
jgi:hypothetical protein